jgi:hypothetical protein
LHRLEEHSLPSSLVLPLQQDYAALCDEVGARGDFDKLTGAILAASTAAVHDMGLQEMMVSAAPCTFPGCSGGVLAHCPVHCFLVSHQHRLSMLCFSAQACTCPVPARLCIVGRPTIQRRKKQKKQRRKNQF